MVVKLSISILGEVDHLRSIEMINKSNVDYLHLDIIDSTMCDKCSNEDIEIISLCKKPLDIHIMSKYPMKLIETYIPLNPEYITIHSEIENVEYMINLIKKNNIKVGLAIEVDTKIDEIMPYLDEIDQVLVMGVKVGSSGSIFDENIMEKLNNLIKLKYDHSYIVSLDGGINNEIIKKLPIGIDILVSGSYLMNNIAVNSLVLREYE